MLLTIVLYIFVVALFFIYHKAKYNESYWAKKGVVFYEKNKAGGPYAQYIVEDLSFFQILQDIYAKYKDEPAVGVGSFNKPMLFVTDPTNIQHVLKSDFDSFNHRGLALSDSDILSNNILLLHGSKWRMIRQKMSPLFTTAKLRQMYYFVDKTAQDFIEYLRPNPLILRNDTHKILSFFCNAALSASVFGLRTDSTMKSPFQKMVREAVIPSFWNNVKFSVAGVSDSLFKLMRFKLFGDHEDFFISIIKEIINNRDKDAINRCDFADICVKLQKLGKIMDSKTGDEMEPTDEVLAAQAFFFFLAGVETSTTAMFNTVVELGRYPDIVKRAQKEVDIVFEKYGGNLTYDAITELKYLNKVFDEGLRINPAVGFLTRRCVRNTVLPVGNIPIEKGTNIFTPIYDLHHDPKYFPNPEIFDPDRFDGGKIANDFVYMPFGRGNRLCLGQRYGRLQVLSGIAHLLRNFTIKTHVRDGGIKFVKERVQVKPKNVEIELISRS